MTFDDVLAQVLDLLQREKRVSYRALKRRFAFDDEYLEDLKDELIKAQRLAMDEAGAVLVWTGDAQTAPAQPAQATPPPAVMPCPRLVRRPSAPRQRPSGPPSGARGRAPLAGAGQ